MTEYITVSDDLYKLLSYVAEKLHCTPSEVVEEAVNEYYYDEKKEMKR